MHARADAVPSSAAAAGCGVCAFECKSQYFSSVFMSKVKESHNFRIPLPFLKHVRIEVENPSDRKVNGYIELTYDQVGAAGSRVAVLRCCNRDAISFDKSCKWVMVWSNVGYDLVARQNLGDAPIPYRHCVYYYSKE